MNETIDTDKTDLIFARFLNTINGLNIDPSVKVTTIHATCGYDYNYIILDVNIGDDNNTEFINDFYNLFGVEINVMFKLKRNDIDMHCPFAQCIEDYNNRRMFDNMALHPVLRILNVQEIYNNQNNLSKVRYEFIHTTR